MQRITPANFISRLFDPIWVLSVLIIITARHSNLSGPEFWRFLAIFVGGMALPPAALLVWAVKTGRVENWDVSRRQQRIKALSVLLFLLLPDLLLVKIFGNAALVWRFGLLVGWFLGFFGVTLFWKISGHAASVTLATLLIVRWYGSSWWPILFMIPLVGWARMVSKNHSLAQVIGGIIYSLTVLLFLR